MYVGSHAPKTSPSRRFRGRYVYAPSVCFMVTRLSVYACMLEDNLLIGLASTVHLRPHAKLCSGSHSQSGLHACWKTLRFA